MPLFALLFATSCSDDLDSSFATEYSHVPKSSQVSVKRLKKSAPASNDAKDLYSIVYKDIHLQNVPLKREEANLLSRASQLDTTVVNVKGYSTYETRTNGPKKGKWYKMAFSSQVAKDCGIAQGTYFVRDIWLYQTYELPTNMAVVLKNNDYTGYLKMGWDPETMSTPGYSVSLNQSTVTFKTGAVLLRYSSSGQQTLKTYPVSVTNLEWHLMYLTF